MKPYLTILLLCTGLAQAQVREEIGVIDAGGGTVTGSSFRVVQSIGQGISMPLQTTVATNGHTGGFLAAVVLEPGLDSDADGLPDELDADNDNDGLDDALEMAGTAFDPVTPTFINDADSDDDGNTDGEEAFLGFNPLDPNRRFVIDAIRFGSRLSLSWQARAGRFYRVSRFDLSDPEGTRQTITTTTLLNGVGPWQEVEGGFSFTTPTSPLEMYMVEAVEQP